jgi:acetyl-CoA carboxylase biotin carboxylase subunit
MFDKVLIANRGEIAVRIARTLREMGIASVAVYSDVDRNALHVRMADEAYPIGSAPAIDSYLRVDRILDVAKRSGAKAIHPGYGFLSENPALPEACAAGGVAFIGPGAHAMRAMGNKPAARAAMAAAGVPIVPGGPASSLEEAARTASALGYPVMLKAAAGGGGKGMRMVEREPELAGAWESARHISRQAFGDDTVYLEKAIVRPRHVEIQVLADGAGNVVHLFERDCSIQRRHQKVVEETPCPVATPELVLRMGEVAVRGAKAVGYVSAGTFEFLLSGEGHFYFLEMNTRLQVEHPVTEWITGVDLVREMVRIAAGEPLGFDQTAILRRGASIECRVYAEDPRTGFLPSPGTITHLTAPSGPGVRDDTSAYSGAQVSSHYDPLVSKLSTWGPDRRTALARMRRALGEYRISGIRTNLGFHERLIAHPAFAAGTYDTGFIAEHESELLGDGAPSENDNALAIALAVGAASRATRSASSAPELGASATLSPWVASHRARLRKP